MTAIIKRPPLDYHKKHFPKQMNPVDTVTAINTQRSATIDIQHTTKSPSSAFFSVIAETTNSSDDKSGSCSSENSYRDLILNPAVYSHVIESNSGSQAEGSSSTAKRKTAPKMGIRRLNFTSPDEDNVNHAPSLQALNSTTPHNLEHLKGGVRSLQASHLSLDISHLSNSDLHKSSCVFNNPVVTMEMPTFKEISSRRTTSHRSSDMAVQTVGPKTCRCTEIHMERERELKKRIETLFILSLIGCIIFLPMGMIALLLQLKARRLNEERTKVSYFETICSPITPHFYAHKINMITRKVLFCINAARFCLLAEALILFLALTVYLFVAFVMTKGPELMSLLIVLLAATNAVGPRNYGSLAAFENSTIIEN